MKTELDSIEERYVGIVNEEKMRGEDYRSRAYENLEQILALTRTNGRLQEIIVEKDYTIAARDSTINDTCRLVD